MAASAALVEEIVFRGLVQTSLQRLAGGVGALAAAGLFAVSYISFGSASLVLLMALAGLLFAHSVARSGVLGAALAGHVLLAAGAAVVWPVLLGPRASRLSAGGCDSARARRRGARRCRHLGGVVPWPAR